MITFGHHPKVKSEIKCLQFLSKKYGKHNYYYYCPNITIITIIFQICSLFPQASLNTHNFRS